MFFQVSSQTVFDCRQIKPVAIIGNNGGSFIKTGHQIGTGDITPDQLY
jgi:hypothetical protein